MLLDELPLSLRIEVAGRRAAAIISAGAPLPAVWEDGFTMVDPSQRDIPLQLLVGEGEMVRQNRRIGKLLIQEVPPPGRFHPVIDVQLTVQRDGSITLKASVDGVNLPVRSRLKKPEAYFAPDAVRRIKARVVRPGGMS
jgi:molecular chaperone DnaK (HSP70)